jgi:hypothetical protein
MCAFFVKQIVLLSLISLLIKSNNTVHHDQYQCDNSSFKTLNPLASVRQPRRDLLRNYRPQFYNML